MGPFGGLLEEVFEGLYRALGGLLKGVYKASRGRCLKSF